MKKVAGSTSDAIGRGSGTKSVMGFSELREVSEYGTYVAGSGPRGILILRLYLFCVLREVGMGLLKNKNKKTNVCALEPPG
jgi:hypothetical protein